MRNLTDFTIAFDTQLEEGIKCIEKSGMQLALVLNQDGTLAGTLSDGDIRRAILHGYDLKTPVQKVMKLDPITASIKTTSKDLLALMRQNMIHHIPLLNDDQKVISLSTLDDLVGVNERPNWVVLMAGGLGLRLRPLTNNCPKPMLLIKDKPILENILEQFFEQGFRKFYISVNYLSDQIRSYFGDGSRHNVHIEYLHEHKYLGTVGSLSLLTNKPDDPLIIMNGDLLTRMKFDQMISFHNENDAFATMAIREFSFQVPYGVIDLDKQNITSICEKPIHNFFISAGVYALSPQVLDQIPKNTFFDMPTLFNMLKQQGKKTIAYPVHEYWRDIGHLDDFQKAQYEWPQFIT